MHMGRRYNFLRDTIQTFPFYSLEIHPALDITCAITERNNRQASDNRLTSDNRLSFIKIISNVKSSLIGIFI